MFWYNVCQHPCILCCPFKQQCFVFCNEVQNTYRGTERLHVLQGLLFWTLQLNLQVVCRVLGLSKTLFSDYWTIFMWMWR